MSYQDILDCMAFEGQNLLLARVIDLVCLKRSEEPLILALSYNCLQSISGNIVIQEDSSYRVPILSALQHPLVP